MKQVSPGRLAAIRALTQVEQGAHAEEALAESYVSDSGQRALALHLAMGVLRRRGALDQTLAQHSRRGVDALDPIIRATLRVGLFDALMSRIRPEAAVDQAVEACRALQQPQATSFVNAVLRKAVLQGISEDPWLDLPPWLARRWAGWDGWVRRLRDLAPICGVSREAGWLPPAELDPQPVRAGGRLVPDAFALGATRGAVEKLPGFAEGHWWVMDPSAASVADLVLEALGEGRGGEGTATVLDACAAPGGKALRLASRGLEVMAVDQSEHRLVRVRENIARTGLPVRCRQHDWLTGPVPDLDLYDAVLVDAPCTGLGIIRRHPEIRWLRLPSDPAAMALRQLPVLTAASHHVAPGGALIYAVCSPMPEEGRGVVDALAGWKVEREWSSVPPQDDEDAFQAFILRRKG